MPAEPPVWLRRRARAGWRVLLVLLLAVISWLAFTPDPPPASGLGWDKANHLLAFGSLALCASLGFAAARQRAGRVALWLLAYGMAIEALQSQIPGRSAEWPDLLADALGIAAGLLLARALIPPVTPRNADLDRLTS